MEPLSSRNPRVQQLRRLVRQRKARAEAGLFVIEGAGLLAEALAADVQPTSVFAAEGHRLPSDLEASLAAGAVPVWALDPSVLAAVASTSTPQPVIATVPMVEHTLPQLARAETTFVVVCAGIAEPGNAGTLIRTAAAAGADAVVFCQGSVDIFNPKVVRSSAGALFRVPVVADVELEELASALSLLDISSIGLAGAAPNVYSELDLTARIAVIFGNEAHGLSSEQVAIVDQLVAIPMAAGVESINVAAAAAAVCFEVNRQRREAG